MTLLVGVSYEVLPFAMLHIDSYLCNPTLTSKPLHIVGLFVFYPTFSLISEVLELLHYGVSLYGTRGLNSNAYWR